MNDSTRIAVQHFLQSTGIATSIVSIVAFFEQYSAFFVALSAILSITLSLLALAGKFHTYIKHQDELKSNTDDIA